MLGTTFHPDTGQVGLSGGFLLPFLRSASDASAVFFFSLSLFFPPPSWSSSVCPHSCLFPHCLWSCICHHRQIYRRCAELDTTGLKDPRLHEQTKVSALYNLGRLLADDDRHQVRHTHTYIYEHTRMHTHAQAHTHRRQSWWLERS